MQHATRRDQLVLGATLGSVGLLLLTAELFPRMAVGVSNGVHGASVVTAGVTLALAAKRGDARLRCSRLLFMAALAATALGFVGYACYSTALGYVPVPSAADAVTVLWVPLAAAGLMALPREAQQPGGRVRAALDGVIAGAALLFASWLVVLEPIYRHTANTGLAKATLLTYPVVDIVVAVIALSVTSQARRDVRRLLRFITVGLLLVAVSDSGAVVHVAAGRRGFTWTDLTLQAGLMLILWGALTPRDSTGTRPSVVDAAVDAVLPFLPVVAAVGFGLNHTFSGRPITAQVSLLAAIMITALVARQLLYNVQLGRAARRLSIDATHDSLTGLANRVAFLAAADRQLAEAAPGDVAVVLFDLNGFKEINDSFGHDAGDAVLCDFAARLSNSIRDKGLAARLGGDEFALLVFNGNAELVAVTASHAASETGTVRIGALDVPVTGSAGITLNRAGDTVSDIMRRADLAMYDAKRSVVSRISMFTDDMAGRADRRHLLAQSLPGAAARGELGVVYQPLYRLQDRSLSGAEALVRWHSPRHGDIPPVEFIPLAEELGVIVDIGTWVLETTFCQLSDWRAAGRRLPRLFVNVSPQQFDAHFAPMLIALMQKYDVDPRMLTLEITESRVPDLQANIALAQLRAIGVEIAMDDFGAGFSSLAQLARLPVDTLKIDRDFISSVHNENGEHILRAVIALARDLGLGTVAEGIEHASEAEIVSEAGCVFAQGYHFTRPVGPAELGALLVEDVAGVPQQRL